MGPVGYGAAAIDVEGLIESRYAGGSDRRAQRTLMLVLGNLRRRKRLLRALLLTCVAAACAPQRPFDPNLQGAERYLCCNLWFNRYHDATDANYAYQGGIRLAAGTPVRISTVTAFDVSFSPVGDARRFTLQLEHARERLTPNAYFQRIFEQSEPRPRIASLAPAIQEAIREGRLLRGMTKEETILARGYPPFHRTPAVEADEWLYFASKGFVDRVRFVDGRITTIETARSNN